MEKSGNLWKRSSKLAKVVFLVAVVVGGYGMFMIAMGTSPIVVVTSGSMEPTMYRGDLIIIQYRTAEDIQLQDIIVYQDNPTVSRVVQIEIIDGEYYYSTKGDNNAAQDAGVRSHDDIIGVVVGIIPWVGNIPLALETEFGIIILVLVCAAIIIVHERRD